MKYEEAFGMERAKIITIANHKGGTAKTNTTYNLGVALAAEGEKVLLVDHDPQSNLTTAFGMEIPDSVLTLDKVFELMMDDQELPPVDGYVLHGERMDLMNRSGTTIMKNIAYLGAGGGGTTIMFHDSGYAILVPSGTESLLSVKCVSFPILTQALYEFAANSKGTARLDWEIL
jgi:hypothetical protein